MTKQTDERMTKNSASYEVEQQLEQTNAAMQNLLLENDLLSRGSRPEQIVTINSGQIDDSTLNQPRHWIPLTIDCLPSLPLQRVFEQLPLTDQFRNLFVNHTWRAVQLKSFATRESLTILVGYIQTALEGIKESPLRSQYPKCIQLEGKLPNLNDLELSDCFHLEPPHSADQLVAAFSRVTLLRISIDSNMDIDIQCGTIIDLLRSNWAANITSLEFSFRLHKDGFHEEEILGLMLHSINAMPALLKLTIECFDNYYRIPKEYLDLPILARLREFRFKTQNCEYDLFSTLHEYAIFNDRLELIEIGNQFLASGKNLGKLSSLPASLKSKMRSLSIVFIHTSLLNSFVCVFAGLTCLNIQLRVWTLTEVNALAQLDQLIELNCVLGRIFDSQPQLIPVNTPHSQIPVLSSVQYVCFTISYINRHQQLTCCHLPQIFPNARALKLTFYNMNCLDCKWYVRQVLNYEAAKYDVIAKCMRQLVQPLSGKFDQLVSGSVSFESNVLITDYELCYEWSLEQLWQWPSNE